MKNVIESDMVGIIGALDEWTTWRNDLAFQMLCDVLEKSHVLKQRMESEGNSQNFEQGKKGTRQSWPKFEEDAFLTMLDDFVAVGQRWLKACPHIESKLKKWKKQYSIVYDMHHKEAAEWRSKPFPLFDTLSNIFGKDHANGRRAEVPADMMEEQSNNEVNASDYCVQEDASPVSLNKEGSQSMNS
ncbi:unnamed protein product [Prunus armeniaca]